jgi:hypothetical protein
VLSHLKESEVSADQIDKIKLPKIDQASRLNDTESESEEESFSEPKESETKKVDPLPRINDSIL